MNNITITFSLMPDYMKKGDLFTLVFTHQIPENKNLENQVVKNTASKNMPQESCASEQSSCANTISINKSNKYAYSADCEHALNLSTGTILYYDDVPSFIVRATQFIPIPLQSNEHTPANKSACMTEKKEIQSVSTSSMMPRNPSSTILPSIILECLSKNCVITKEIVEKVQAETNIKQEKQSFYTKTYSLKKQKYSLAVITLSDKGFEGKREDRSGPALMELVGKMPMSKTDISPAFSLKQLYILPDEVGALRGLVTHLAYTQGVDCIITTGGTGLSNRDITPNALLSLLDSRLYGFEHAMMTKSLEKTPHAMLSRTFSGIIHKSLLICVPGSVKAATENIEAILPALPHALSKLTGDMSDCGG